MTRTKVSPSFAPLHYWARVLSLVGLISLIIYALTGPWFRLTSLTCQLQNGQTCPASATAILAASNQRLIFTLSPSSLRQELQQSSPQYQIDQFNLIFPHTLNLVLAPVPPLALVQTVDGSFFAAVTDTGIMVPTPSSVQSIPIVQVPIAPQTNSQAIISPAVLTAIRLAHLLALNGIISEPLVLKDNTTLTLQLSDGRTVLFTPLADPTRQVTTLQRILRAATMKSEQPLIDVRFEQPVLKPVSSPTPVATDSGQITSEGA